MERPINKPTTLRACGFDPNVALNNAELNSDAWEAYADHVVAERDELKKQLANAELHRNQWTSKCIRVEGERDELKKQLAQAVDKIASYSKDADEYRAALEYAKADMREGVKVMVGALEVELADWNVTFEHSLPGSFKQGVSRKRIAAITTALEQARKLGIVEGQK